MGGDGVWKVCYRYISETDRNEEGHALVEQPNIDQAIKKVRDHLVKTRGLKESGVVIIGAEVIGEILR